MEVQVLLDSRMKMPEGVLESVQIKRVKPLVFERFKAERWLAHNVLPETVVLCFGNLPPLFKLRGHVVLFVQNKYLIDDVSLGELPFRDKLRLSIERLWLSTKMKNVDEFFVQTPEMKRMLVIRMQVIKSTLVKVVPFVAQPIGYVRSIETPAAQEYKSKIFLYVATGGAHKNHKRLIDAWCLLAEEGIFPLLRLTIDDSKNKELCLYIEGMRKRYELQIYNEGGLSYTAVIALYNDVDALIYPSTFESLGLPLIEARQAGLHVLAPEMDYVRDVLDPEQTFDPKSPVSIARAVKRFLGVAELPLPLLDAREFINHLIVKFK
jgi:glycosyltransferase involved in cell wall biosynthesis